MFILECLDAGHGDCLILHYGATDDRKFVLIDGGPSGIYKKRLKNRLGELRADVSVNPEGGPLMLELGMVSHIDADHITGILDLFKELGKEPDRDKQIVEFKKFWHNSLAHLVADVNVASTAAVNEGLVASVSGAAAVAADQADHNDGRAESILASVKQGADLEAILVKLGLGENTPFSGAVKTGRTDPVELGDLSLRVVWPDDSALGNLKTEWKAKTSAVEIAAFLDKSVANLSSIVVAVEYENKTILLTGDARGNDILKGLKAAGFLENGTCHFDVLKMPHHGSARNMETGFLEIVVADTYVFSADGKHDNPDAATLEMIRQARPGAKYRVVLTNQPVMETESKRPGFEKVLAEFASDPNVDLVIRENASHSVLVKLS